MIDIEKKQRKDYTEWLSFRKKANGESYSRNTVGSYVSSLSTAPARLEDIELKTTNMYEITSASEFANVRSIIEGAKNFEEVNVKAGNKAFQYALQYYEEFLQQQEKGIPFNNTMQLSSNNSSASVHPTEKISANKISKNTILYGPPGTGKTYHTVLYAVCIIENKSIETLKEENYEAVCNRYNKYKTEGKIAFTTFHQSYGYEEFIEGIKPRLTTSEDESNEGLEYKIEPGMFKAFCDQAKSIHIQRSSLGLNDQPTIWKVSLQGSGENELKQDCFQSNRIRIGWNNRDKVLTEESTFSSSKEKRILLDFQDEMKVGDIVLSLYDKEHIDGIGVITGDAEWLDDDKHDHYPRSRTVRWLAKNIKENILEINQGKQLTSSTVYRLHRIDQFAVIDLIKKHSNYQEVIVEEKKSNYVFIIDEINRGNISKIFGELITLIESTKRLGEKEAATAKLPYSGLEFGVPNNVFIIGTMNTADRSIALMDTALRRRFTFIEMMPDANILSDIQIGIDEPIDVKKMLTSINDRISFLYDREHTIGHAYFTPLLKEPTIEKLSDIFQNAILPLLQEYFYEDYEKIQLVLGDNEKEEAYKFIKDERVRTRYVFKGNPEIDIPEKKYNVQTSAFSLEKSYIQIYE